MAADDETLLSYIIKGQDQTRAMLEQHAEILNRIAESAQKMAASVEDAGKKTEAAAPKISKLQQLLNELSGSTDSAGVSMQNLGDVASSAFKNPTKFVTEFGSTVLNVATGPIALAVEGTAALAAGTYELAKSLVQATESAVAAGAQIDNIAKKVSDTSAHVSEMSFAVRAVGSDMSTMSNAMFTLQQRLELNTATVKKGLDELGKGANGVKISLEDLANASPLEQMLMLSDAFRQVGDSTNAAAAIGEIFTKRFGKELLPILDQDLRGLVQASKEVGASWGDLETQQAKALEVRLNTISLEFETIYNKIGRSLLPALSSLATGFEEVTHVLASVNVEDIPILGDVIKAVETWQALYNIIHKVKDELPPVASSRDNPGDPNAPKGSIDAQSYKSAAAFLNDYNKEFEQHQKDLDDVASSTAKLREVEHDLHADFEAHKRDLEEVAAIQKVSINAQLAQQTALINQTETGFQAQMDIAQRAHAAHMAILDMEFKSGQRVTADLLAENAKYAATRLEITNKSASALADVERQMDLEINKQKEDANASWLSKRYQTIDAETQATQEGLLKQFGYTSDYYAALERTWDVYFAKRAAAESQSNKKAEQDIAKVEDDIQTVMANAQDATLAKAIDVINARIQKEKDHANFSGKTAEQLEAYRIELSKKADAEIYSAALTSARKLADDLFAVGQQAQAEIEQRTKTGLNLQLSALEQQHVARLRDLERAKDTNKALIDEENKLYGIRVQNALLAGSANQQMLDDAYNAAKKHYDAVAHEAGASATEVNAAWQAVVDADIKRRGQWFQSWVDVLQKVPQMVVNALTGGGGLLGALEGIGSMIGSKFLGDFAKTLTVGMTSTFASLAGPIGAAVGSLVGPLIGKIAEWFHTPEYKRVMNDVGRDWGISISEGLAKEIAGLEDKYHVSRSVAEALDISKIVDAAGGMTAATFDRELSSLKLLLGEVERGGNDAKAATEELDKSLKSTFDYVEKNLDGVLTNSMQNFIGQLREAGVQSDALAAFLDKMVDKVSSGTNKTVAGFAGGLLGDYDKIKELTDKTLPDLLKKREDIMQKMADNPLTGKSTPSQRTAFSNMEKDLADINKQIEDGISKAQGYGKELEDAAAGGQEQFDRLGRIVTTSFAAQVAAGKNFVQVLQNLGPSLDQLSKLEDTFGFKGSEAVQKLLGMRDIVANNKDLADSISGLNDLMSGLSNLGALTQSTFTDLGDEAAAQFDKLKEKGADGNQALALMQPTLQKLYELQEKYGYTTDETTQKLLDQAEAAGIVGEKQKDPQQQMLDFLEKMLGRFDLLLAHFGVLPQAAASAGGGMAAGLSGAAKAADDLAGKAREAARAFGDMGRAAQDATDTAYDGQHGVIYGNSPGGLTDVIEHLKQIEDEYKHWETVAHATALTNIKDTLDYAKALQAAQEQLTLDETTDPTQNAILSATYAAQRAIADAQAKFGLAANDIIALIQQDLAVKIQHIQEAAAKAAAEKAAQEQAARVAAAKGYANQLIDAQIDSMANGLDKTIAQLNHQKDEELAALKEKFGDQVDFYNQQAAIIEQIYGTKIAKAIEDDNQKALDAIASLQKSFLSSYRSLQDELQDVQLNTMADGTDKQLAQMEVQKERRLRALAEQFGAESDMYRQQAAIIDQIYGIQAKELLSKSQDASLLTLQKSYYALLNSPVSPGAEGQRQADLQRLSAQIQAAQAANLAHLATSVPTGLIPSATTNAMSAVIDAVTKPPLSGTVRLEISLTDLDKSYTLESKHFDSIEEAIATGKIVLTARNASERAG